MSSHLIRAQDIIFREAYEALYILETLSLILSPAFLFLWLTLIQELAPLALVNILVTLLPQSFRILFPVPKRLFFQKDSLTSFRSLLQYYIPSEVLTDDLFKIVICPLPTQVPFSASLLYLAPADIFSASSYSMEAQMWLCS